MTAITNDPGRAAALGLTESDPGAPLDPYLAESSGWGWRFFAASMLGLAGVMRIIDSIWAFGYHGALPNHLQDGVLGSNLTNYAWLWLSVGALLIICSFAVMTGSQLARWVGIVGAAIAGISAFAWMPYYPVWSLVYIGLASMQLYALAVHGGRIDPSMR
jgi:hypothetical protein